MNNDRGGIHIHTVTLKEFTSPCGREPRIAGAEFCDTHGRTMSLSSFWSVIENASEMERLREPSNVEGFSIAHQGDNWGKGIICIWDDATGQPVGGQAGGTPYVMPEYRGLKLGREIQIRAFETGLKRMDTGSFFSPEGLASRKSAHRFCVARALENGLDVPPEVLIDYPELIPVPVP